MPKCGRCGEEAKGFAAINDVRYCHEHEPDCDELQQWEQRDISYYDLLRIVEGLR